MTGFSDDTHISVPGDVGGEQSRGGPDLDVGDKPMSATQANQLKMLASELGVPVDLNLTGRQAARKIAELESRAGRGAPRDSRGV